MSGIWRDEETAVTGGLEGEAFLEARRELLDLWTGDGPGQHGDGGDDDETWLLGDAARWTPQAEPPLLTFGKGRSHRMTLTPWGVSQETELGRDAAGWWRRCVTRGCRVYAGPYPDAGEAKLDGMLHQHYAHDTRGARA